MKECLKETLKYQQKRNVVCQAPKYLLMEMDSGTKWNPIRSYPFTETRNYQEVALLMLY